MTLNSDALAEIPSKGKFKDYLLPRTLTDATKDGGLFGIVFEPSRGERPASVEGSHKQGDSGNADEPDQSPFTG